MKFRYKFLLRNALVFILKFKMVFWAVWNRKGAQSHTPHKAPGYPASTHCSNSQHRWTNGKVRDQLGYFPPVKSQKHDNKVLQIWLGEQSRADNINSILLKCVLFLSYVAASTLPSLYRYFDILTLKCLVAIEFA